MGESKRGRAVRASGALRARNVSGRTVVPSIAKARPKGGVRTFVSRGASHASVAQRVGVRAGLTDRACQYLSANEAKGYLVCCFWTLSENVWIKEAKKEEEAHVTPEE